MLFNVHGYVTALCPCAPHVMGHRTADSSGRCASGKTPGWPFPCAPRVSSGCHVVSRAYPVLAAHTASICPLDALSWQTWKNTWDLLADAQDGAQGPS